MNVFNFFSIPFKPMPEIFETIPGKNSLTIVLLKPTVSKITSTSIRTNH